MCAPETASGPMMTVTAISTMSPPAARVTMRRSRFGQAMSAITTIIASNAVPATGSSASRVFWSNVITGCSSWQNRDVSLANRGEDVRHRPLPELQQQSREEAKGDRQHDERRQGRDLRSRHIRQVVAKSLQEVGHIAEDDAL